jgi:hypothetical protein
LSRSNSLRNEIENRSRGFQYYYAPKGANARKARETRAVRAFIHSFKREKKHIRARKRTKKAHKMRE